jgi:hypothetical protein
MARSTCAVSLAISILFLGLSGTALAQNQCAAAKIRAAGKKAKCLLSLEAKEAKTSTAPDSLKVQRCKDKLSATFSTNETNGGCLTTGDADEIEDKVDAFVADVDGELYSGGVDACAWAKLKAAGKEAACLLGLMAKAAANGNAPDATKVARCKEKLLTAFTKAETKGGCNTTGDAADIDNKVDAFVVDADGELSGSPTTTTATTNTSTTTTTSPVPCGDTFPSCNGSCPSDQGCAFYGGGCSCVTASQCAGSLPNCFSSCDGPGDPCPPGYGACDCGPQPDPPCACVGPPCGSYCSCPPGGICIP